MLQRYCKISVYDLFLNIMTYLGGKQMRKVLVTSLASIILVVSVFAFSTNAASAAENGFYSIKTGQEKYHSINDFKKMSMSEKKNLFKTNYYIVAGPTIYPISSLLLSESDLTKEGTAVVDFEAKEKVNLEDISKAPINSSFEVIGIE